MSRAIRAVGIVEIIGGLIGVLVAASTAESFLGAAGGTVALAFFASVSACSVFAGILLLKQKRIGLHLSRAVQIVQIPVVSVVPVFYCFGLGLFLAPGLSFATTDAGGISLGWPVQFYFGANFMLALASELPEQYVAVNAFAVAMLWPLLARPASPVVVPAASC